MKKLIFLIALFALGFVSCKKDGGEKTTPTGSVTNFNQLKTTETFDWKTTKDITLSVSGLQTLSPVIGTFRVSSTDNTVVFYQAAQSMDQNATIKLSIPSYLSEVKVSFGSVQKTFPTSQSTINFDYLMPVLD